MTAHTPGPWKAEVRHVPKGKRFAGEKFFELMAGDFPLATLNGDNAVWLEEGADEANARLIAASPELLTVLKNIEIRIELLRHQLAKEMSLDQLGGLDVIQGECRAAIAKAEGQ